MARLPFPGAAAGRRRLEELTQHALADMRYPLLAGRSLPARPGQAPLPVPERVGEPSLIHHVIYIIKENRTYDQVLGDINEGNGDPALCIFNTKITPNEHKLTHDFVLLDNTYCCGSRSPDGHQWTDSAMATDYMEKSYAGFPRSYPLAATKTARTPWPIPRRVLSGMTPWPTAKPCAIMANSPSPTNSGKIRTPTARLVFSTSTTN